MPNGSLLYVGDITKFLDVDFPLFYMLANFLMCNVFRMNVWTAYKLC